MTNKTHKICLDAGHYAYYNQSPANRNYYEAKAMWTLHLLLKKYLEQKGFVVVTTRSNQEKDLELTARGRKAKGCDLFLSLHSNAVGSYVNENVDYVVVYRLTDDNTTKIDEISNELAYILAPIIASTIGTKQAWAVKQRLSDNDRNYDGIFNDNYYGVLHGARTVGVPGLILEHSFHTNTRITNWLLDESNLDRLAKVEAEAIAKYFGMTGKTDTPATKPTVAPTEDKYYRVRKSWDDAKSQIGAYKILDNAKKPENCPEGYTVYDWNGKAVYPINNVEPPKAESKISVLEWQEAAIADGFEFPIYGADGLWGDECEGVAQVAIVKNRGKDNYLYRNLTKLAQKAVGLIGDDIDGMCYEQTEEYIIAYQRAHNLEPDGCVGINTWKVIIGVK